MTKAWAAPASSFSYVPPDSKVRTLDCTSVGQEAAMTSIRVQYDAYNRQFNFLDGQCTDLQDGETYVIMDFSVNDFDSDSVMICEQEPAHA